MSKWDLNVSGEQQVSNLSDSGNELKILGPETWKEAFLSALIPAGAEVAG